MRLLKPAIFTSLALAALVGLYLVWLQLSGNFHTVIAGELYRSAQPSGADIETYRARYGIRTIVNLRDDGRAQPWYAEEIKASDANGIEHIDFPLNASRDLTEDEFRKLVTIFRNAPKPILIHCKSGADRTGLATVVYLNEIAGVDEETAEEQLSLRYGHIGLFGLSSTFSMDRSWESEEVVLGLDK